MHEEVLLEVELGRSTPPDWGLEAHQERRAFACTQEPPIVRYPDDPGIYLRTLTRTGQEQTDTWHKSVDDAQWQATFEFEVQPEEWRTPA